MKSVYYRECHILYNICVYTHLCATYLYHQLLFVDEAETLINEVTTKIASINLLE